MPQGTDGEMSPVAAVPLQEERAEAKMHERLAPRRRAHFEELGFLRGKVGLMAAIAAIFSGGLKMNGL
jgi:hypothetical protein